MRKHLTLIALALSCANFAAAREMTLNCQTKTIENCIGGVRYNCIENHYVICEGQVQAHTRDEAYSILEKVNQTTIEF